MSPGLCASATNALTLGECPLGPPLPLKSTETKCICCQPGSGKLTVWRRTSTRHLAARICAEWVRRRFSLLGDVGAGITWKLSFRGPTLPSEWPFSGPPGACDLTDKLRPWDSQPPPLIPPYFQSLGCCLTLTGEIHLPFLTVYKAEPVLGHDSTWRGEVGSRAENSRTRVGPGCLPACAPGTVLSNPHLPESL